jgi:hypothetical protein
MMTKDNCDPSWVNVRAKISRPRRRRRMMPTIEETIDAFEELKIEARGRRDDYTEEEILRAFYVPQ